MRNLLIGLRALFHREAESREMDEELRDYLDRAQQDKARRGAPIREARVDMGSMEALKDEIRGVGWEAAVESFWRDVRFGARLLVRRPGFTIAAVLSLALGIGANTAIFSVIDALMLRSLPARQPEQLYTLQRLEPGNISDVMNYRWFERYRALTPVFADAAAIRNEDRSNVIANGVPDESQVRVGIVTGNYFAVLGVGAALGRCFTGDDDRLQGGHPVVVLSHRYWGRMFAGDPDAVGRTLALNGTAYKVLGVAPPGFSGEHIGRPTDFWVPLAMLSQVLTELPPEAARGGRMNYVTLARLRPGVSRRQAESAAQVLYQSLWKERLGPNPPEGLARQAQQSRLHLVSAAHGYSPQREGFARPLAILMVSVGMLLLLACANVANLLIARLSGRQREFAVRLALGAGRQRVVRQLLTESVLLAVLGGALGLVFASWANGILAGLVGAGPAQMGGGVTPDPVRLEVHADARVLLFTLGLSFLAGIAFGVAPALRGAVASSVRGPAGLSERTLLRKSLVVVQVAISLVLLIGAGLFARTLRNLQNQDLGLDRQHTLLVWTSLRQGARILDRAAPLFSEAPQRLAALAGVQSASASVYGLLNGSESAGVDVAVAGQPVSQGDEGRALSDLVAPRYFETLGMRLVAGRDFNHRDDAKSPPVVVVNEALAQRFFGGANPIGQRIDFGSAASNRSIAGAPLTGATFEIVGVVSNAIHVRPRDRRRMMFYRPYRQDPTHLVSMCLAIRTSGPAASMAGEVRRELRRLDARLPILHVDTVDQQLGDTLGQERLVAMLSVFLGGAAVLLACLGLYGVVSYSVSRRTNEIGVRIALGAARGHIIRMVLADTLLLIGVGIVIGVPAALAGTRAVASQLYGITANDTATFCSAVALMPVVAALAGWIPARRAARVDPVTALRWE